MSSRADRPTEPLNSPTEVVERFVDEVLNGSRPAAAPELLAAEPLRRRVAALRSAFADLRVRPVRVVARGRYVAIHFTATGTHTGRFRGGPPSGRPWSASATAILEVENGRIVDGWMTWDLLEIAEQIGLVERSPMASA